MKNLILSLALILSFTFAQAKTDTQVVNDYVSFETTAFTSQEFDVIPLNTYINANDPIIIKNGGTTVVITDDTVVITDPDGNVVVIPR